MKQLLLCDLSCLVLYVDEAGQQSEDFGAMPSWDDDGGFPEAFDDGNAFSDVEESSTLVSQPRQVCSCLQIILYMFVFCNLDSFKCNFQRLGQQLIKYDLYN